MQNLTQLYTERDVLRLKIVAYAESILADPSNDEPVGKFKKSVARLKECQKEIQKIRDKMKGD